MKSTLLWRYVVTREMARLHPVVDGRDLLAEFRNNQGQPPERLLPPLSSRLVPAGPPKTLALGLCGCGIEACGSMQVTLRRSGDEVLWEPLDWRGEPVDEHGDPVDRRAETLPTTVRFDLRQYLDALDAAAADRPGEGRGSRAARAVGPRVGAGRISSTRYPSIDWVSAWPWADDAVRVCLRKEGRQVVHTFTPEPGEGDKAFADRVTIEARQLRYGG